MNREDITMIIIHIFWLKFIIRIFGREIILWKIFYGVGLEVVMIFNSLRPVPVGSGRVGGYSSGQIVLYIGQTSIWGTGVNFAN